MTERGQSSMNSERVYKMMFSTVYPLYLSKAERKGRTSEELDEIISWLTGYSEEEIRNQIERQIDFETFFNEAPRMNPNAHKITGTICGYRVEEIEDPIIRKVRYLDKLVDELAKGKSMDTILRK